MESLKDCSWTLIQITFANIQIPQGGCIKNSKMILLLLFSQMDMFYSGSLNKILIQLNSITFKGVSSFSNFSSCLSYWLPPILNLFLNFLLPTTSSSAELPLLSSRVDLRLMTDYTSGSLFPFQEKRTAKAQLILYHFDRCWGHFCKLLL